MDDGFQCCKQILFNKFVCYSSPQWLSDHIKKHVLKSSFFSAPDAVALVQEEFCVKLPYLVWPLCGFLSFGQSTPSALLPVSWLHKPFRQGH